MTSAAHLINQISWPREENLQAAAWERNLALIDLIYKMWQSKPTLYLNQDTEPSIQDWSAIQYDVIEPSQDLVWLKNGEYQATYRIINDSLMMLAPNASKKQVSMQPIFDNKREYSRKASDTYYYQTDGWRGLRYATSTTDMLRWHFTFHFPRPKGNYHVYINLYCFILTSFNNRPVNYSSTSQYFRFVQGTTNYNRNFFNAPLSYHNSVLRNITTTDINWTSTATKTRFINGAKYYFGILNAENGPLRLRIAGADGGNDHAQFLLANYVRSGRYNYDILARVTIPSGANFVYSYVEFYED